MCERRRQYFFEKYYKLGMNVLQDESNLKLELLKDGS